MSWLRTISLRVWQFLFGKPILQTSEVPPTNWCLVGNIVDTHNFGAEKKILRGTKQFSPGTKVYCLPAQWGDGYEKAIVVGLARRSRRWITVVMKTDQITNWRAKVVYQETVLSRLRDGFQGFDRQWKSRKEVEGWAKSLRQRDIDAAAEKMRD